MTTVPIFVEGIFQRVDPLAAGDRQLAVFSRLCSVFRRSRWTVGRTLHWVNLDVDLGHSIELGVYQGGVDAEPAETSYTTSDLVFLRQGALYLRTDKVYETKRQIGKPVRLRPVD